MTDRAVMLLPLPDSPTIPRISTLGYAKGQAAENIERAEGYRQVLDF
jgi:hypothetical protein